MTVYTYYTVLILHSPLTMPHSSDELLDPPPSIWSLNFDPFTLCPCR